MDNQNDTLVIWLILIPFFLFFIYKIVSYLGMKWKVGKAIDGQIKTLARRKRQLVYADAYGKLQQDKWVKEIEYFISNHIDSPTVLTTGEQLAFKNVRVNVMRKIDARVNRELRDNPAQNSFSNNMTPTEFEIFCAEELQEAGWDARVTKQSGDQGVDVIAEKDGVRVAVQCKLYSKSVGNKAVQEVVAARAHEQAHHGIVVSNNDYTPSAHQLASTNNVLLLHFSDLANLEDILQRD